MALHFTTAELETRRAALTGRMQDAGLDGLLMFRQESMFWLTGYDTFGYVFFQCLVLTADGRVALITRAPDLRQAQNTSNIEDIRIWVDRDEASPADALRDLLDELGLAGTLLGVEYEAYGLTGRNALRLNSALQGFASLDDCSEIVSELRLVKSSAEIKHVRRAAALADDALEALRSSESDASTQRAARDVQRILHEEAPAIFLAASQDARAVSRRFEVPDEPGRDVVETLWRWRLAGETPEN